ncbi:endonuclease/exonuclease/phosphatase family protein [Roseivirga sp. E12]|uniref:endonuclease/exonuclease/phosphatase family protein n=1 Tax=Roseivirga sp. E12 TaxID=2819237 RepID=UPI001ABD12A5|nr:endonuclease/exonuclease/phosphatase family protein [Roseivirga sp. E12]MBO3697070.1 hypothetical protein [Roseivirga sp. E12]
MIKKVSQSTSLHILPKWIVIVLLTFCISPCGLAQKAKPYLASESFNETARDNNRLRLVFYNVENLFDYFDDSTTMDEEFLPRGGRFWNKARYETKQKRLAQTIMAIGGWEPPALIGLCEVENRYVLNSLTGFTALKTAGYEIIHQDSPDNRGIDVAALYRPDKFELINYEYYPLTFPFDTASRTRDILHVIGKLPNQDTLHLFVNHWPSKYGGEFETEPKRMRAAQILRSKVDSLLSLNSETLIVLTGDFNDEPQEDSIIDGLAVNNNLSELQSSDLYNLMYPIRFNTGTHSFQNNWSVIDQFIVTGALMNGSAKTSILGRTAQIFDMPFLITEGATGATRPFRTYQGPKYIGGYSDHLPILLDLVLK